MWRYRFARCPSRREWRVRKRDGQYYFSQRIYPDDTAPGFAIVSYLNELSNVFSLNTACGENYYPVCAFCHRQYQQENRSVFNFFIKKKRKTNKINKNMVNSFCSILFSQHKNRNLIVKPEIYSLSSLIYIFLPIIFFFFLISEFLKKEIGRKFRQASPWYTMSYVGDNVREHVRAAICVSIAMCIYRIWMC